MKLTQFVQWQLRDIASKIDGLAHLFSNYRSTGSRDRDSEGILGLGTLLEDLADQAKRLAGLMESIELTAESAEAIEIEFKKYDYDQVGTVEKLVEELIERRRSKA